jgi:4-hydroxybenzoate polyprenyltransferase
MSGATVALPTARPGELRFWRAYAVTMRPYLLFVSGSTGIAGVSLVQDVPIAAALVSAMAFFLAYGFGQALTDCFQTDTDALSAPYRPLVRGVVRARDVFAVSLAGLVGCGAVLVAFHPATLVPAALAVCGLATYTWFKRRWWGGPWYNAWIVSLVVLLGYQAGSGAAHTPVRVTTPLIGMMTAAFAAYANFVLTGYYKDIAADRVTGYRTLPVVFGRGPSAWVSDALAAIAFVGAVVALWGTTLFGVVAALPFLVAAVAAAVQAQVRLHSVTTDAGAHRAIAPVVHGYILLLGGLAAAYQPLWLPGLALFYLAFVAVLSRRPMAAQI